MTSGGGVTRKLRRVWWKAEEVHPHEARARLAVPSQVLAVLQIVRDLEVPLDGEGRLTMHAVAYELVRQLVGVSDRLSNSVTPLLLPLQLPLQLLLLLSKPCHHPHPLH